MQEREFIFHGGRRDDVRDADVEREREEFPAFFSFFSLFQGHDPRFARFPHPDSLILSLTT